MCRLGFEEAEEPEIKLPTFIGSWRKQGNSRKHICFFDYAKAFDCMVHHKLWKILKKMGVSDHLTCLLRNIYGDQEATVRIRYGTTDWFQIEKVKYVKAVYCHFAYLTYMQSTSCEMLGWMNHKLGSRLLGEISITSDMQVIPPLWQKVKN